MESEWIWERYERTYLTRPDGRKCYIGHFRREVIPVPPGIAAWDNLAVVFWAKHPIIAMRAIWQSGRDPAEFHGQMVN